MLKCQSSTLIFLLRKSLLFACTSTAHPNSQISPTPSSLTPTTTTSASPLSSPPPFSLTLHRLNSLSLPHKTLLIANHLLSSLHHLTLHFQPNPPPPRVKQRDLDSVLLLLLLCDVHQHNPEALQAPTAKWREILCNLYSDDMLTVSGIGVYNGSALVSYIEVLTRCLRFVSVWVFAMAGKWGERWRVAGGGGGAAVGGGERWRE
ncbi:E3 ubiquitin-protein ligase SGR9 amyloplastic [Prunus yedoensis var. nudiflora]|uniref:E3 ubiquitin-protein ligase SGR9 amyloplastic n=1 Tax=Prunus yedoensis var. nudiflora TaxID=2094558 RepID=A0A314UKA7_PRUYE|nr:E3 ubiquitin-protein ligase SGR9 amyloplastic [Prunus yedoensis var. nudiflora]